MIYKIRFYFLLLCFFLIGGCDTSDKKHKSIQLEQKALLQEIEQSIEGSEPSVKHARSLLLLGRREEAVKMFDQLIDAGDDVALFNFAVIRFQGDLLEKELAYANQSFEKLCKDYIEACVWLAWTYEASDNYEAAEKAYLRAADSDSIEAIVGLYEIYAMKNWAGYDLQKSALWSERVSNGKEYGAGDLNILTRHLEIKGSN